MKKEEGLGTVGAIIIVFFITITIIFLCYMFQKNKNETKKSDINSNMLLIQGSCKVLKESSNANKEDNALIGTKLSEFSGDIIDEFKTKGIISEEEYEKYYVLTDDDLSKLNIAVKNENDSYYLINYENTEVIFTKGSEGKYKLSEFE